jgi:predicted dehydrogenase
MKTIRWGMIGCGSVAEIKSGPGFQQAQNSVLAALTSRRREAAHAFAEKHGVAKVHETAEALVADPGIDAVYIATPPSSHKAYALLAAGAGKHVYVEKPMAMNAGECRDIAAACERSGVRLYIAFYRRAMPRFLQIKEWITSGAIGEVRCVRVLLHQRPETDEMSRETLPWRVRPDISGAGKFLDMGIHMLDFFEFVFGPINEAQGIASNRGGLYDAEDTVTATWRHASGVQGCGSWCYVCGQAEDRIEIAGSQGRIEFEFFADSPIKLYGATGNVELRIANPQYVQQPFIQSIVDDLNGVAVCPGDVESALRSAWVADEILKNYRSERRRA